MTEERAPEGSGVREGLWRALPIERREPWQLGAGGSTRGLRDFTAGPARGALKMNRTSRRESMCRHRSKRGLSPRGNPLEDC